MAAMISLQTVVELPEFLRRAKALMTDEERAALVYYIAANPEAGIYPFFSSLCSPRTRRTI